MDVDESVLAVDVGDSVAIEKTCSASPACIEEAGGFGCCSTALADGAAEDRCIEGGVQI